MHLFDFESVVPYSINASFKVSFQITVPFGLVIWNCEIFARTPSFLSKMKDKIPILFSVGNGNARQSRSTTRSLGCKGSVFYSVLLMLHQCTNLGFQECEKQVIIYFEQQILPLLSVFLFLDWIQRGSINPLVCIKAPILL